MRRSRFSSRKDSHIFNHALTGQRRGSSGRDGNIPRGGLLRLIYKLYNSAYTAHGIRPGPGGREGYRTLAYERDDLWETALKGLFCGIQIMYITTSGQCVQCLRIT